MVSRITVLGTGYLGTTHAACLADMGFEVLGVDTDDSPSCLNSRPSCAALYRACGPHRLVCLASKGF